MPIRVGEQFRGIDSSAVSVTSHLLQGKVFCVLTAFNELTKKDIETKIIENGGTVVQNPGTFLTLFSGTGHTVCQLSFWQLSLYLSYLCVNYNIVFPKVQAYSSVLSGYL